MFNIKVKSDKCDLCNGFIILLYMVGRNCDKCHARIVELSRLVLPQCSTCNQCWPVTYFEQEDSKNAQIKDQCSFCRGKGQYLAALAAGIQVPMMTDDGWTTLGPSESIVTIIETLNTKYFEPEVEEMDVQTRHKPQFEYRRPNFQVLKDKSIGTIGLEITANQKTLIKD